MNDKEKHKNNEEITLEKTYKMVAICPTMKNLDKLKEIRLFTDVFNNDDVAEFNETDDYDDSNVTQLKLNNVNFNRLKKVDNPIF